MWAVRVLTGAQAGQTFKLKPGINKIGRAAHCDIQLNVAGISKEHLEINVVGTKITIRDLQSSNGTFINGIKVNSTTAKMTDKISVYDVILEIISAQEKFTPVIQTAQPPVPQMAFQPPAMNFKDRTSGYIDRVVLPGAYQLTEVFEFRHVLMGFVLAYVLIVTMLSVIPMNRITSESINNESRRRAMTVARALAQANEKIIRAGDISNYRSDLVLREEGIEDVYVLSKDGTILAPPERAGMSPKEIGFVKSVKGQNREVTAEVNGNIGAAVPINVFDPELQQNVPKAHAVVIYNPGSLKFDDGRALSLFIQMLAIALVIGFLLYFFLFKIVEYPLKRLNIELDLALREGREHADIAIKFPMLQHVLTNVNSLLARSSSSANHSAANVGSGSRDPEMISLLGLIGYSSLLIKKDKRILAVNGAFEQELSISASVLQNQKLNNIPDQALQKNIESLVQQSEMQPTTTHSDRLDYHGRTYILNCQAVTNFTGEVDYYIVTIAEESASEGGAA